jgi:hypothetical protein
VDGRVRAGLAEWKKFVVECLQEKGADVFQFYWNAQTAEDLTHDTIVEEYDHFVARIRNSLQAFYELSCTTVM